MRSHAAMARWMQAVAFLLLVLPVIFVSASSAAPKGSPWNASYFPDVTLVNQDGKKLNFYRDMIENKAVMINFIFATCEDACPLETAKLRQVQEQLGELVGREVFMYSISITPDLDTPEVLKEYMKKYKVGPGWQFLTGSEADINAIRRKFGLMEEGEKPKEHTMDMVIGNDKTGVWIHRSSFDKPKQMALVVLSRLLGKPIIGEDYGLKSHVFALNPGEDLYRRRCQDCHNAIGKGDSIGPDLLNVTQSRQREWLKRYIQVPNEVLAEKDPIAMALHEKYQKVLMPNLRLSDGDVEFLMGYMEAESRRVKDAPGTQAANQDQDPHAQHGHDHHHH
jgi:protein SCO1/2